MKIYKWLLRHVHDDYYIVTDHYTESPPYCRFGNLVVERRLDETEITVKKIPR